MTSTACPAASQVACALDAARSSGRLAGPLRFPHERGSDWVIGVVGNGALARPLELAEHDPGREQRAWEALVAGAVAVAPSMRDDTLPASVDGPAEGAVVKGRLVVRGWGRLADEDLGISLLVDGVVRVPASLRRVPRPDVATALPHLGPCATAGYEAELPFEPGDDGPRELRIVFHARDGRYRLYPVRTFTWAP